MLKDNFSLLILILSFLFLNSPLYSGNPHNANRLSAGAIGISSISPQINPVNPSEVSFVFQLSENDSGYAPGYYFTTSTDWGATWTTEIIYQSRAFLPDSSFYFTTDQFDNAYSQDGNFHIVFNGFGYDSSQNRYIFPIVYWNRNDRRFTELTTTEVGRPEDMAVIAALMDYRPGNGIGNAFPKLAVDPYGALIVIWQQWEDDGAGGIRTRIGQGGFEIFMTDIYGNWSPDGDHIWGEPFFVAGTPNESDLYPDIARDVLWNSTGDSLVLDIMYLRDTNPGISIFAGGNDPSECIWYYDDVKHAVPLTRAGTHQEMGRTWYDDISNPVGNHLLAHAYNVGDDGIHFLFTQRMPDQNGPRFATYDYWDRSFGLFFGNQSITSPEISGAGSLVNGQNDEMIAAVSSQGDVVLYQDASETAYSFSEILRLTNASQPSLARLGNTVILSAKVQKYNGAVIDTLLYSLDYMSTWQGNRIEPLSNIVKIDGPKPPSQAAGFRLEQNYPNPFNPETAISYRLSVNSRISIKIYDIMGREIATLVNKKKAAGEYRVKWNGRNSVGQPVASGVYIYRLQAGSFVESKKMLLIR